MSSQFETILKELFTRSLTLVLDTWNETSYKTAWDESTPPEKKGYHVYAAAKTEAERSAWEWVKQNRPGFVFNSVLPDGNVRNYWEMPYLWPDH